MSDSALEPVLVPYARFLECRQRRIRIAAELTRQDEPAVANDERARDVDAAAARPELLQVEP